MGDGEQSCRNRLGTGRNICPYSQLSLAKNGRQPLHHARDGATVYGSRRGTDERNSLCPQGGRGAGTDPLPRSVGNRSAMSKISDKLDRLAERMVNKALMPKVSLEEQSRVFQVITQYYAAQNKARKGDEDESGVTFNRFRERVAAAEHANGEDDDG